MREGIETRSIVSCPWCTTSFVALPATIFATPTGVPLSIPPGLVHEAYMKLAGQKGMRVEDRGHFLAIAACAMRQVIISRARARLAAKRGGGEVPMTLDEERVGSAEQAQAEWLLDLDRALELLRERDERLARTVECRFFAGLSEEETARALGVSLRTAQRNWMRARAWLRAELTGDDNRKPLRGPT